MRILYLLGLIFLLYSCSHVRYEIEDIRPNEIGLDENLSGKVFAIDCDGNGSTKEKQVNKTCVKYIAQFAYQQGYEYFSVLDSNSDSQIITKSYTTRTPVKTYYRNSKGEFATSTTYVPQNNVQSVVRYHSMYMFVLIKPDEIKKFGNYYKVSDHYVVEDKPKEDCWLGLCHDYELHNE